MSSNVVFTKDNIDDYLKATAKEYRKTAGKKMPAEMVLIGGASILLNYGFRNMTTDVDAIIYSSSAMKEAINTVGDQYNLPNGWLNTDFTKTTSYSKKLLEFSVYYKTFFNVLTVRTISAEYLIAMKLVSAREYKNDLSDIIGILYEHQTRGERITWEKVDAAVTNLYGGWGSISDDAKYYIYALIHNDDALEAYSHVKNAEQRNKAILTEMFEKYPDITRNKDVDIDQIIKKSDTSIKGSFSEIQTVTTADKQKKPGTKKQLASSRDEANNNSKRSTNEHEQRKDEQ